MSQLANGQRVRVEVEGVVDSPDSIGTYVRDTDGRMIYVAWEMVTPLDPDHWPPQAGDIWEANGFEYMIRDVGSASATSRRRVVSDNPYLLVSPLDQLAPTLHGRLASLKAANPTLIRRRGGFHK